VTSDEIDVVFPRALDDASARRDLAIYLATWQAMNPGATARLLPEPDEPKAPEVR
jgi:hypothetical protein